MVTQDDDGRVDFLFLRPNARDVWLAGDFNGWQQHCLPMTRRVDGWWHYRLQLALGVYRFRYHADGQWYTDYAACGVERGPFGWNSILVVDSTRRDAKARAANPPELDDATEIVCLSEKRPVSTWTNGLCRP